MSLDGQTSQREYQREYARKRRAAIIAAQNALSDRCQALLSRGHPCRTWLQNRFVDGKTVPFCPTCDRKARGVCIVCESPEITGIPRRALYCALHQKLAKAEAYAKYRKRHRRQLVAKERRRVRDPEKHADRLEYKRQYRQVMAGRIKRYKQEYTARHADKVNAYHAAYRARHAEERRERERLRARGELPPRACLTCPTVLTGRAKKCPACKAAQRASARQAIVARLERAA
jgi:hypothetical protein